MTPVGEVIPFPAQGNQQLAHSTEVSSAGSTALALLLRAGEPMPPPLSSPAGDPFERACRELKKSLGTAQRIAESLGGPRDSSLLRALEVRSARRVALESAWLDASTPGWDGYGAEAVTPETLAAARAFLDTLSTDDPTPEISADPDGEISFDWYRGPDMVFSVSVADSGRLSYAGLFGRNSVEGKEWYDGSLPGVVAFNLARLYRNK